MKGAQYICVVYVLVFLCACSSVPLEPDAQSTMTRHTLVHDDIEREYYVYLPPAYEAGRAYPVLFFLHGYGGTATGAEAETTNGLNRFAARYKYIAVYPQGTWFQAPASDTFTGIVTSWNDLGGNQDEGPEGPLCKPGTKPYPCPPECGDCGRCGWSSCHDDTGFLARLIDVVARDYSSDAGRQFLAGFSNGSMMSQRLACTLPERFAAVALFGGRLERGYQCAPAAPLPMLQLGGGRDDTVPWDGHSESSDFFYASAERVHDDWAKANQCADQDSDWSNDVARAHALRCVSRCADSAAETISCLWPDGGHVWPGYPVGHGSSGYCASAIQIPTMPGQTLCAPPDRTVDVWGSRLMFDFFERHRIRNQALVGN